MQMITALAIALGAIALGAIALGAIALGAIALGAIALGVLASRLLYLSWQRSSTPWACIGWVAMAATLPLWIKAEGIEYGTVFAFGLPALLVWLWILPEQKWQGTPPAINKPQRALQWRAKGLLSGAAKILYLVPGLMLVSSLTTLILVRLLPTSEVNQIATGILLLPVLWGTLAWWYFAALQPRFPLLFSLLSSIVCGFFLFAQTFFNSLSGG